MICSKTAIQNAYKPPDQLSEIKDLNPKKETAEIFRNPLAFSHIGCIIKHMNIHSFEVIVQDGGKTVAKAGVKLAYKHVFAPVFTSEESPMLLVRPRPGKKMSRPEQLPFEQISEGLTYEKEI